MSDGSMPSEEAMERAREKVEECRDLAESDLTVARYAEVVVSLVEEYENGDD